MQFAAPASETSLHTRAATHTGPAPEPATGTWAGTDVLTRQAMLATSLRENGFLAIGVPVHRPGAHIAAAEALAQEHDGQLVDVTGEIVGAMRDFAAAQSVPWDLVRGADAAAEGSRDARGLRAILDRVMPALRTRLEGQVFGEQEPGNTRPLILVEVSPLARYGYLDTLARLSDLSAPRRRPVWVVLPQLRGQRGALVDGNPIQLGSPGGQFVVWSGDHCSRGVAGTAGAESEKV
ncbi:MAG: hypothetical protein EOO27_05350 [Comamonadaceae bacterium]|nr:MAG: hypothetical protein EOO27_05350 [Comamonadaceae bacterium]